MEFSLLMLDELDLGNFGLRVDGLSGVAVSVGDDLPPEKKLALLSALNGLARRVRVRPLESWVLSTRARNILVAARLETLFALQMITAREILRIPHCGAASISEITREALFRGYDLPNWFEALRQITKKYKDQ